MADKIGELATNNLPDEPQKAGYVYGWSPTNTAWRKVEVTDDGKLETSATFTASGIEIADVGVLNVNDDRINPATEETLSALTLALSGFDFATETTLASGVGLINDIKSQTDKLTFDGSNNLEVTGTIAVSGFSPVGIGSATCSSVTVTGSTLALAANPNRTFAVFTNDSDATMFLAFDPAVAIVDSGIRLNAMGGSFKIDLMCRYTGAVYAISDDPADKILCVVEG